MYIRRILLPDVGKARDLVSVGWPLIIGLSTYTFLLAMNTAFLGRVSPAAQGVVAICDVAFLTVSLTLSGIGVGTQVLSARRLGEGRPKESGAILDNSLLLAAILGIVFTVLAILTSELQSAFLLPNKELADMSSAFLKVRYISVLPVILFSSFQGFFIGLGKTGHFLIAATIRVVINVFLDYTLIFGKFGMPEMGLQGAAWAGTISSFASTLYFIPVILLPYYRTSFGALQFSNIRTSIISSLTRLSMPAGIRQLILLGSYLGFFMIIGMMGTVDLAASNVTRATFNILFMPVIGMGFAVSSLVSRNLGEGRPKRAEEQCFSGLHLTLWLSVASYVLLAIFAPFVSRLFTTDPAVAFVSSEAFRLGGPFLMFVPLSIIFAAVLEGAGLIWFLLIVEAICCTGYLYIVYVFGIQMEGGLVGAYQAELVYWIVFGVIMAFKFFGRGWHRSKV